MLCVVQVANTTVEEKSHNLAAGDNVEVSEGELLNLRGKVLNVDCDKIVMIPDHEDLKVRCLALNVSRSERMGHFNLYLCRVLHARNILYILMHFFLF